LAPTLAPALNTMGPEGALAVIISVVLILLFLGAYVVRAPSAHLSVGALSAGIAVATGAAFVLAAF
jgi:Kef-type K+ transport system membrane component KefB